MEQEEIERILEASMNAPSGDNSQPWQFKIEENAVIVYNIPQKDPTLFNYKERGSYLAHGALVENICVAASAAGYSASVTPFPGQRDATAKIQFSRVAGGHSELSRALMLRTTNRKPYERKPLESRHAKELLAAASEGGFAELRFAEARADIDALAKSLSLTERILMENKDVHDFLFATIRWSEREERERAGLYVMTMEFPAPVRLMMRYVIRFWPLVLLLNLVGLSRAIPKQSAAGYAASSAFGAIIVRGESDKDFFDAGRSFEKTWLCATKLEVSIQPVTAMPYLMQRVRARETASLTARHIGYIKEASQTIEKIFQLQKGETVAMVFRMGYGAAPTAHSAKASPRFVS